MANRSIKKHIFNVSKVKRIPVSGTFELTPRCNLDCKMCYIHMNPCQQVSKELTTEQWLDIGKQAVDNGMLYLLITGGEPLLRPDFIRIYTEMVKSGVIVSINTNGTCITQEIVDCFKEYPPEKVNVSLYGSSSDTYLKLCGVEQGYSKAFEGILKLKEAGIRVTINTTFTTYNEKDIEELVLFAKNENIPIRTAAYVFPKVRNGNEKQTVTLSIEEHARLNARFEYLTLNEEQIKRRIPHINQCLNRQVSNDMIEESKASNTQAPI